MTDDPKSAAILASIVVLLTLVACRRQVLRLSLVGIFSISYFGLVLLGVLLAPWTIDNFLLSEFPYLYWDLIGKTDLTRAIWVSSLPFLVFVVTASLVRLSFIKPHSWERTQAVTGGNLAMLPFMAAYLVWALLSWGRRDILLAGLMGGYGVQDSLSVYDARFALQSDGRLPYLLSTVVIPFCSWVVIAGARATLLGRLNAVLVGVMTIAPLLLTFEKMALIVYWMAVGLVALLKYAPADLRSVSWSRLWIFLGSDRRRRSARRKMLYALGAAFGFLLLMFFLSGQSRVSADEHGAWSKVYRSGESAVLNAFTRQSIQPLLYTSYFPSRHGHYGFSNVGLLAGLLGFPFYSDTREVLYYYSSSQTGSTSIGALGDFYGGFGFWGAVFGAAFLGILMAVVDLWLGSLRRSASTIALFVGLICCAFYASQAALPRVLVSYGAVTYVCLWFLLDRCKIRTRCPRRVVND